MNPVCDLELDQGSDSVPNDLLAELDKAFGNARPYKPAFPPEKSREIICEGAGTHFDPEIVAAFLARYDDIRLIREQLQD